MIALIAVLVCAALAVLLLYRRRTPPLAVTREWLAAHTHERISE